jgi:hypothetical protein
VFVDRVQDLVGRRLDYFVLARLQPTSKHYVAASTLTTSVPLRALLCCWNRVKSSAIAMLHLRLCGKVPVPQSALLRHLQFAPTRFLSSTYLATPPAVRADAIPKPHLPCYDQQLCLRDGCGGYGAYELVMPIDLESSNTEHA